MSSTSCWTSCSVRGFIGSSVVCTHSENGGWKWIPLGADSQWPRSVATVSLGGCPKARANARANPSTDSYPAPNAASVTVDPRLSCQAARSSITRRRIATGGSPASRESRRLKWYGDEYASPAMSPSVRLPSSSTASSSSRSRSRACGPSVMAPVCCAEAQRARPILRTASTARSTRSGSSQRTHTIRGSLRNHAS